LCPSCIAYDILPVRCSRFDAGRALLEHAEKGLFAAHSPAREGLNAEICLRRQRWRRQHNCEIRCRIQWEQMDASRGLKCYRTIVFKSPCVRACA
jgi:hypothetical protein